MEESPESNTELKPQDLFTEVNNYFLLFFCGSCLLCSMYLQQLFIYAGHYRIGIGISPAIAIILPVSLMIRRVGPRFARQIRLSPPRLPQLMYVALSTLAAVVIVDQIYIINQQFYPVPKEYIEGLNDLRPVTAADFVLIFAGLCVVVPVSEELLFRGMIQQIFSRNMGPVLGFLLAGLAFGVVHLNAHLLISISFFGIFLSFVFFATGNLLYTVIAHALFNTVALLQLTFSGSDMDTDLPFYLRDVRIFVVCAVLMVFFLYKLKKGGPETEPPYET